MPEQEVSIETKPENRNRFSVLTYLAKSVEDDKGDWWLVGIASGPRLDLQNERVSDRALEMMRSAILSGQIPLRKSHWGDWDEEMGFLREGTIEPSGDLEIRVWLDKQMPYCQTLKRRLDGDPAKGIAPRKLGLSMGGRVMEWFLEAGPNGSQVRVLDAVELDHVCVTSSPAYPGAMIEGLEVNQKQFARRWVADMAKAVDWRRVANPETASPAEPDAQKGAEEGGTTVPILNKSDPNPPPSEDVQPPADQPDQDAPEEWKTGCWRPVKEIAEADHVWIKKAQEPPPEEPAPPPPPEGEKSMNDETARELIGKIGELVAKVDAMTNKSEALQTENDALKAERKGIHPDGGGAPPAPGGANYVEQLKKSERYQNASPQARMGLLAEAMKQAGASR